MNYRRFLPNLCTAMNLVFGMCSILSTVEGHLDWGALFILFALVADGLDGRIARAFGVSSEFGKEMDSLCDLGSFGIAPALLAWTLALHTYGIPGIAVTIFFAVCGMWRLTRFNVNVHVVHGYFMGLAIPAGGNLVAMSAWLFLSRHRPDIIWPALSRRCRRDGLSDGQSRALPRLQGRRGEDLYGL